MTHFIGVILAITALSFAFLGGIDYKYWAGLRSFGFSFILIGASITCLLNR